MINNFALIIGAMKCGTTSLFNYLAQHPEIAVGRYKEVSFFSIAKNYARGFDYYQSLWNWDENIHKFALEATPGYTQVTHQDPANAAENIAKIQSEFGVNFKFIYIIRDPLKRIESHYLHNALEAYKVDIGGLKEVSTISQDIIDTSKYARQLDEYYQRFSADSIFLLDFAQFTANPQQSLSQICRFLDIDDSFQFEQTQVVYNSSERLRLNIPLLHNFRYTRFVKYLRSLVPKEQKSVLKSMFGTKYDASFKLPESLKTEIITELRPDIAKLHHNYHFDVSSWNIELQD